MNEDPKTIAKLEARISKLETEAFNREKIEAQREINYAKIKQELDLLKSQLSEGGFRSPA
jgi:hypothetical protein